MYRRNLSISKNLSKEEIEDLKNAFELFDTAGTGKVNPSELKHAMESLGLKEKNPFIYNMISDLDTKEAANRGGVTYDAFCDAVNFRLGDKDSKDGIRRIYELFIDDPDSQTITINSLSKVSKELGNNLDNRELNELLVKASNNGSEITFEEFYEMMIKK
jgi:Ca2+-binding EF-hand superfamily protein